jgi:hypothetical protein
MKWREIVEINFLDGGSFIADKCIEQKLIPRFFKFFAKITKFASKMKCIQSGRRMEQYSMLCQKHS